MKEENTLRDENISLLLLMEECCSDNEYYEGKLREYQEKLIQIEVNTILSTFYSGKFLLPIEN